MQFSITAIAPILCVLKCSLIESRRQKRFAQDGFIYGVRENRQKAADVSLEQYVLDGALADGDLIHRQFKDGSGTAGIKISKGNERQEGLSPDKGSLAEDLKSLIDQRNRLLISGNKNDGSGKLKSTSKDKESASKNEGGSSKEQDKDRTARKAVGKAPDGKSSFEPSTMTAVKQRSVTPMVSTVITFVLANFL